MTDLEDLYSQRIMELAANIPRTARLAAPQASATAHSKLCGSTITVDLRLDDDDDSVTDFGQTVKACLLGQSSAAVVGAHIVGATADEMIDLQRRMKAMLKSGGPVPGGRWQELEVLEPVRDFKPRHASIMLVFDAVVDAIQQIRAARLQGQTSDAVGRQRAEG